MILETVVVVTLDDIIGYTILGIGLILFLGGLLFIKVGSWIADRKEEKRCRLERERKQREYDLGIHIQ